MGGDYAYKNLMRSPGRFFKSVGVMFVGIAALSACFGIMDVCAEYLKDANERYGYYQVYYKVNPELGKSMDEIQKNIPSTENLETMKNVDAVTGAKRVYQSELIVADDESDEAGFGKRPDSKW